MRPGGVLEKRPNSFAFKYLALKNYEGILAERATSSLKTSLPADPLSSYDFQKPPI